MTTKLKFFVNDFIYKNKLNCINDFKNLSDNEFISFSLSYKVDLGINHVYLGIDKNEEYCYYRTQNNEFLNTEILFDSNGDIIFQNGHSNMCAMLGIKKQDGTIEKTSMKLYKDGIINDFLKNNTKNSTNIKIQKEKWCHHYSKETIKYPIKQEFCHILGAIELHNLIRDESALRKNFNKTQNICLSCGSQDKLSQSHLVSANNIKVLINNNNVYYASRIFNDLNNKQLTSLMTISEVTRNEQNTNFKIACFCSKCEQLFTQSDLNAFTNIEEITDQMILKTFGIYTQEIKLNMEFLKLLYEKKLDIFSQIKNKMIKERDLLYYQQTVNFLENFKNGKLEIFQHTKVFDLINKPFIECCTLSYYENYFYIIIITNKDKKMHTNIITNDPNYPKEDNQHILKIQIFYAAITLNKYIFYQEEFHREVKELAYNMIYDYYNNDYYKYSHPLLLTKINYNTDLEDILKKYLII